MCALLIYIYTSFKEIPRLFSFFQRFFSYCQCTGEHAIYFTKNMKIVLETTIIFLIFNEPSGCCSRSHSCCSTCCTGPTTPALPSTSRGGIMQSEAILENSGVWTKRLYFVETIACQIMYCINYIQKLICLTSESGDNFSFTIFFLFHF